MKARTAAANQLHSLCDTAPDVVRARLRGLSLRRMVAVIERWRPGSATELEACSKRALVSVAKRWRALDAEIAELQSHIEAVLDEVATPLLAVHGVGYETAGQLLVTAGDNAGRLRSERTSPPCARPLRSRPTRARPAATGSTGAATATPTAPRGRSCVPGW